MIKPHLNMVSLIESKSGHYYKIGLYLSLGWGIGQLLLESMARLVDLLFLVIFGAAG